MRKLEFIFLFFPVLGQEACQYKALKKCAKKLRLLPKKRVKDLSDFEKCDQRKVRKGWMTSPNIPESPVCFSYNVNISFKE